MKTTTSEAAAMSSCPAFVEGCPFDKEEDIRSWLQQNKPETIDKCVAFKDGNCPFKGATTAAAIKDVLHLLPESHTHAGGVPHEALTEMFAKVHAASSKVKQSSGLGDCPVFAGSAGGCPFKGTLCSNGVPLIDAVEYRSWGVHALSVASPRAGAGVVSPAAAAANGTGLPSALAADPAAHDDSGDGGGRSAGVGGGSGEQEAKEKGEGEDEEEEEAARVVTVEVSKLLKEGTKQAHRAAENVHYVKEFVRGRVSREVYQRMVANLYFVYKALEDAFDDHASSSSQTLSQIPSQTSESLSSQSSSESQHSHSHSPPHPLLAPVYFPKELHRASALEEDLAFYYGDNWRELTEEIVAEEEEEEDVSDDGADDGAASRAATVGSATAKEAVTARKKMVTRVVPLVRPSPVAQAYVARLHELSSGNSPELLVPHAYTRYLGDLSGGQVLKRAGVKGMQLDASTGLGVKFYEFEHILNLREFKALYREKLDSLGKTTAAAATPAAAATATTTAACQQAAAAASDSTSTRRTRTTVMTSSVADLMVAEANYAFELNTALFVELDLVAGFCDRPVVMPKAPVPELVHAHAWEQQQQLQQQQQGGEGGKGGGLNAAEKMKEGSGGGGGGAFGGPGSGCPFASLAKAGVPMPAHHPKPTMDTGANTATSGSTKAANAVSKCPLSNYSLVDVAVVLVLVAMMMLAMPNKPPLAV